MSDPEKRLNNEAISICIDTLSIWIENIFDRTGIRLVISWYIFQLTWNITRWYVYTYIYYTHTHTQTLGWKLTLLGVLYQSKKFQNSQHSWTLCCEVDLPWLHKQVFAWNLVLFRAMAPWSNQMGVFWNFKDKNGDHKVHTLKAILSFVSTNSNHNRQ